MQDYYKLLGVGRESTFSQIKAAYRQQAMEHHPDRGGFHAQMVQINEAWEVLSNPDLRNQYDQQRKSGNVNDSSFEEARQRSTKYERDWRKFDSWLSSISRDFGSAKFGSKSFMGIDMPTASGSVSAWAFLIMGGVVGFLFWLPFGIAGLMAWREEDSTKGFSGLLAKIALLSCIFSVACGASGGAWIHQRFGASFAGWLVRKMPFSSFTTTSVAHEKSPDQSRDKPPPKRNRSVVECPSCGQRLRAPSSSKTLTITCPKCRTRFDFPNQTNQQERSKMNFPPNKTSLATLLRCLLIFEIVFTVILIGAVVSVSAIGEGILANAGIVSPDLSMLAVAFGAVALVVLLPAGIASWVGLFKHRNWARWLYLISLTAGHLLSVFAGCFAWTYSWDLVSALESIAFLTSGIIVSICFLSPLASEFVEFGSDDTA